MYKVIFYFKAENFNITITDISTEDKNKIQDLFKTDFKCKILNQNFTPDSSKTREFQFDLNDVRYIEYIKQS